MDEHDLNASWCSARIRDFYQGYPRTPMPFNEMLFSGNTFFNQTTLEPVKTPLTESRKYEAEYERLAPSIDAANTNTNPNTCRLNDTNPQSQSSNCSQIRANRMEVTCVSQNLIAPVKLLIGTCFKNGTGTATYRKLYFSHQDDWFDAKQSFDLWTKAHVGGPKCQAYGEKWLYRLELPKGETKSQSYSLESEEDFRSMMQVLRRRQACSAVVFQKSWHEAVHKGHIKLEDKDEGYDKSEDTHKGHEWDKTIVDAGGNPVFYKPDLWLMKNGKHSDIEDIIRDLKLPLSTKKEYDVKMKKEDIAENDWLEHDHIWDSRPAVDNLTARTEDKTNLLSTPTAPSSEEDCGSELTKARGMTLRSGRKISSGSGGRVSPLARTSMKRGTQGHSAAKRQRVS